MSNEIESEVVNRIVQHLGDLTDYHFWDDLVECEGFDWDEIQEQLKTMLPRAKKSVLTEFGYE